jgi:hypothetical protein
MTEHDNVQFTHGHPMPTRDHATLLASHHLLLGLADECLPVRVTPTGETSFFQDWEVTRAALMARMAGTLRHLGYLIPSWLCTQWWPRSSHPRPADRDVFRPEHRTLRVPDGGTGPDPTGALTEEPSDAWWPSPQRRARAQRRRDDREFAQGAVEALRTSAGFRAWLRARRSFRSFSLANQVLIAMQDPDATYVAGFRRWLQLGYAPRRGSRALKIWGTYEAERQAARRMGGRRRRPRAQAPHLVSPGRGVFV